MDPGAGDHAERDDAPVQAGESDDGYRFLPGSGGVLLGTVDPGTEPLALKRTGPLAPR